jgi:hypothetical protein
LLPAGTPLAEAEILFKHYGDELAPDLIDFIRRSKERAESMEASRASMLKAYEENEKQYKND